MANTFDFSADSPIIGIDLGTTNSCIAFYNKTIDKFEALANTIGNNTTPSVVCYNDNGETVDRLIGLEGVNQGKITPKNAIYAIKRLMGQNLSNRQVQQFIATVPYDVIEEPGKDRPLVVTTRLNGTREKHTPEEVSALILSYLKSIIDTRPGVNECTDVVITIPAHFSEPQRAATRIAAEIAGFKNIYLLNEPTAAAICYANEIDYEKEHKIFLFDFGGGTLDCSILATKKGSRGPEFKVIGIYGNPFLGGEDIDIIMTQHMLSQFQKKYGIDITKVSSPQSVKAMKILKDTCTEAKHMLSFSPSAPVVIDSFYEIDGTNVTFESKISKAELEDWCEPIWDQIKEAINECLIASSLEPEEITDLIVVGGSSRIPKISQIIQEIFNKEPLQSVNPDEAIAIGAAVYNKILRKPESLRTSSFMSSSMGTSSTLSTVSKLSHLLSTKTAISSKEHSTSSYSETDHDSYTKSDHDKLSEIIDESHKDDERPEDEENEIILVPENFIEILPLTIGIRSKDGLMSRVISKSTKLPAHKEVTITTTNDNQEIGAVKVYQGERDFVKNNIFIGKFDVPLPPKPKGEVKFIVDVYVDKQLNIKCTAKVLCSDLPETTHVMKSKLFRLDDEEVERLKEQAKIWRKEDNLKIDALHAKNDLLEQLDKYKKAARKAKLKDAENQVKKEIQAVLSMNTPNKDIEAYIESLKNIRADLEKKFGYLLR